MRAAAAKKNWIGACLFCGAGDASLLDNHRGLVQGSEGGRYEWANILPLCPNCHRKCHQGHIEVLGRHPSTGGVFYYRIREAGVERLVKEAPACRP